MRNIAFAATEHDVTSLFSKVLSRGSIATFSRTWIGAAVQHTGEAQSQALHNRIALLIYPAVRRSEGAAVGDRQEGPLERLRVR